MLNNTKHKSELSDLREITGDHLVTGLDISDMAAANSGDFSQSESAQRRMRRERRLSRNTGLTASRWRVSLW